MVKPKRNNPFGQHTFQELCVMLNAEYHYETAYRDTRMVQLMEEIVFRINEMRELTKQIQAAHEVVPRKQ